FDSSRFDAAVYRGEFYKTSMDTRRGHWSRQDYEMVADVLKNSIASDAAKAVVAQGFADRFWYDNPNFKPDLFFKRALGPDYKERTYRWDEYTRASYGDYGGRRVRVHQHFRSRPRRVGGSKRMKTVHVRSHYREV